MTITTLEPDDDDRERTLVCGYTFAGMSCRLRGDHVCKVRAVARDHGLEV